MTRATAPPILAQLHSSHSVSEQVAVLRLLKNDLIGHDQRKEAYVAGGILPALAQVLAVCWPGKAAAAGSNGAASGQSGFLQSSEETEACQQAILIVGSLAQGGPPFLAPIFASDVLPRLLAILASPDCPQSFIIPILRLLNTLADRIPLQSQEQFTRDTRLADLVFAPEHIGALRRLVAQDYDNTRTQTCIELAAALVGKLCTEETHKTTLAECGVLDALGVKIGSFVVAQGFVLPGAEAYLHAPGALGEMPTPAPTSARLAPILRAVTVIVEQSKLRAEHLLSSPGIVTVFPKHVSAFAATDIKKGPWGSTYSSGSAVPQHAEGNPVDSLLPSVPLANMKSYQNSVNFPPLGQTGRQRRQSHSYPTHYSLIEEPTWAEEENAIIPWLLCVLRSDSGMVRLMAARLVTVLFRLGLAKKYRVPMFSYLLLPILIRMLEKDFQIADEHGVIDDGLITPTQRLKEEAPAVLANLVMDDQELQRNAVEGKALKRLTQLLKETFNPITENLRPTWSAGDTPARDSESVTPECRLGPPGYSPMLCHVMRYRENILKGLGSLVPFKDEYRKIVCESGVVPYLIDSLKLRPSDVPTDATSMPKNTAADGNPTSTLLAACGAIRMLTRSVSILRTNLVDAGVAPPLFTLMQHRDLELQIASTAALANLALDFSPMKELIISAGMVPVLCKHAHSSNTKLRIEALWVLKHVVYSISNDIRIKIIELLTPAWIRQIISQDAISSLAQREFDEETEQSSGIAMGRVNSAGQQVDILNPMEDEDDSAEDSKMTDTMPSSKMSLDMFLPDARRRRKLTLHGSLEQSTQSRRDDIAVQEQMFHVLRNIICGPGSNEMLDYIFREIGKDELMDALADKLRVRTISLPHREISSRGLSVPTEILVAAGAVVVHIAASLPRQRQAIMDHPDMLKSVLSYFDHSHRDVRANCIWTVINLIYEEDRSDHEECRQRAAKLKALGFPERAADLLDDADVDIRERAKTVVDEFCMYLS